MNEQDRDDLLKRLATAVIGDDSAGIKGLVGNTEEINAHLRTINGRCHLHSINLTSINGTLYGEKDDGGLVKKCEYNRKMSSKNRNLLITLIAFLAGLGILNILEIIHLAGL